MQPAGTLSLGIISAMLLASLSFAGSRSELGNAAERLEQETRVAAEHADTVAPNYREDAHELARLAADFRSVVETATVSDAEVSARFERVANSYQRFREQVERANTQQAFGDLRAVTAPYEDVERDLGISPGSDTRPER
jgi:hypothetical protein